MDAFSFSIPPIASTCESGTSSWGVAVGGNLWIAGSVDVNQWQHIAVVYDEVSKTAKFYKNGIESVYSGGKTNFSTSSNPNIVLIKLISLFWRL